jgi:hypothetical protein
MPDSDLFTPTWLPSAAKQVLGNRLVDFLRQESAVRQHTVIAERFRIAPEMQLVEVEKVSNELEHE